MKTTTLMRFYAVFALVILLSTPARSQTVITFDDIASAEIMLTNGYQGLSWSNFGVGNSVLLSNALGYAEGYNYGMVSPSNVCFNWAGNPAEVDARGTNFDLLSTYLTGAWKSNLNIEVQGFRGGTLLYDTTVVASATNATLFTFDYMDIDRLYFNSFGGEEAFGDNNGNNFVMDNMTFAFIPEPSSFLLAALGAVSLVAFLRRRRV
jgi:hypothetical protein